MEKIKLTKKSLLTFLDNQISLTKDFEEGSEDQRRELYKSEWGLLNEKLKSLGIPKVKRGNRKRRIKQKYGLVNSEKKVYNVARIKVLRAIKDTFILE